MYPSASAGKSSQSSAAAFIVLVVIGYVLSVGPVLVFAERLGGSNTRFAGPLRTFYSPLFATARAGRLGTSLYETYVGMWHRVVIGRDFPKEAKFP